MRFALQILHLNHLSVVRRKIVFLGLDSSLQSNAKEENKNLKRKKKKKREFFNTVDKLRELGKIFEKHIFEACLVRSLPFLHLSFRLLLYTVYIDTYVPHVG